MGTLNVIEQAKHIGSNEGQVTGHFDQFLLQRFTIDPQFSETRAVTDNTTSTPLVQLADYRGDHGPGHRNKCRIGCFRKIIHTGETGMFVQFTALRIDAPDLTAEATGCTLARSIQRLTPPDKSDVPGGEQSLQIFFLAGSHAPSGRNKARLMICR